MDELTPEARRTLMAARAAAEPSDADRARVFGLVAGAIAASTVSSAAASTVSSAAASTVSSTVSSTATATSVASMQGASVMGTGLLMKVGAALILSFGGGYGLHAFTSAERAPAASLAARPAVTTSATTAPVTPPETTTATELAAPDAASSAPVQRARSASTKRRTVVTRVTHVAQEVDSIARAEQALAQSNPQAALRALKEHADQFPHGQLRQERWGLRVIALCMLDADEGGRAATTFLNRHQGSVLTQRVVAACATP